MQFDRTAGRIMADQTERVLCGCRIEPKRNGDQEPRRRKARDRKRVESIVESSKQSFVGQLSE